LSTEWLTVSFLRKGPSAVFSSRLLILLPSIWSAVGLGAAAAAAASRGLMPTASAERPAAAAAGAADMLRPVWKRCACLLALLWQSSLRQGLLTAALALTAGPQLAQG
jgi:hypothetical protein